MPKPAKGKNTPNQTVSLYGTARIIYRKRGGKDLYKFCFGSILASYFSHFLHYFAINQVNKWPPTVLLYKFLSIYPMTISPLPPFFFANDFQHHPRIRQRERNVPVKLHNFPIRIQYKKNPLSLQT